MSEESASKPNLKKSVVIGRVRLNEGRDDGDMVRESDPKGSVTVHNVNKTQRLIDRLHRFEEIDDRQYDAATYLRDLHERATLLPQPRAHDLTKRHRGGSEGDTQEGLWEAYLQNVRALVAPSMVISVVVHDEWRGTIRDLRYNLDRLADYQGLDR